MQPNPQQLTLDEEVDAFWAEKPVRGPTLTAANCRACGFAFLDTNGKRLCDTCLAERVNGAGELEDDDSDDPINRVPCWASAYEQGIWALVRDYWRVEIIHRSPALARLERICKERGWDYEATVRVLR